LNGFVSDWLVFQAILLSPDLPQWGPQDHGSSGRRPAGAFGSPCRRLLRQGVRRDLSRAARARPWRPRRGRSTASRSPRCSPLPGSALFAGILPGLAIDGLSPVTLALIGERMPVQTDVPWLSIVPIAESRSSYNGLLVFLFTAISALLAALRHPPLRLARASPGAALGLRLPGPQSDGPVHRRQLCAAYTPRLRHARLPRPRAGRHAGARRICDPPASPSSCATSSGTGSTPRSPAR